MALELVVPATLAEKLELRLIREEGVHFAIYYQIANLDLSLIGDDCPARRLEASENDLILPFDRGKRLDFLNSAKVAHLLSPKLTREITCDQISLLRKHYDHLRT